MLLNKYIIYMLIIIILVIIIKQQKEINELRNIEKFAVTDDIRAVVKEIYNTDMEAVRQLAKMAEDLRAGGIKIPGNLIVTSTITSTGDISSASYSLSGLNSSITNNNNNITNSLNATNANLNTTNNNLNATNNNLYNYVKYSDNIRITNRGTGQPEYGEPYIGVCGYAGQCSGKIDVTMVADVSVSTFKIVKT